MTVVSDLKNVAPEATGEKGLESGLLQPPEAPSSHNNLPQPPPTLSRDRIDVQAPNSAPAAFPKEEEEVLSSKGHSHLPPALPTWPCLPGCRALCPVSRGSTDPEGRGEGGTQKGGRSRSSVKEQKGSQCPDGKFLSCKVLFRGQEFLGCETRKRSSSPAPLRPLD